MIRLRVKEVLQDKGVSMSKLSRLTDISYNTVQILCRNPSHNVEIQTLGLIAQALKVPLASLFEEIDDTPTE